MAVALPEELVVAVNQQIALRQSQLLQLSLFYSSRYTSPRCLIAHGPEHSNKLEAIQAVLDEQQLDYVVINCRECLSQRHLLNKIFTRCVTLLGKEKELDRYDRLDNINALASNLRKFLQGRTEKLVIIVLGADQQRGATATLFPALARLGTLMPCLSLIISSSSPRALSLHRSGIPHLYFPPYTRDEAIQLLLRDPPNLLPEPLPEYATGVKEDKVRKIYDQFATVLYDTLIAPTTNSITKYRLTCERLWPRFIWPLLSGERVPGRNITASWDFATLVSRNRILFQSEGEEVLQERLVSDRKQSFTYEDLIAQKAQHDAQPSTVSTDIASSRSTINTLQPSQRTAQDGSQPFATSPLLKYLPTLLLLSAYLASHTHQKHDIVLFSRLSNASSTNRRKKKYLARSRAGGITNTPTKSPSKRPTLNDLDNADDPVTPTKKKMSSKELGLTGQEGTTPKKERADRSMRAIFEKTSNIARPFTLERVVAILRAIHPDGLKSGRGVADRIYAELGELDRLRLVIRADTKRGDAEDIMEEKWKCVVGREWVVECGKKWNVGIEGFEVE